MARPGTSCGHRSVAKSCSLCPSLSSTSFPSVYSCFPALTACISHREGTGFMIGPTSLQFLHLSTKGRSDSTAQLWSAHSGGQVPQRDTASLVLWVSTVCCAWELLSGLYKRAVLSLSIDVSEEEMTPTAFLYAQAGLSKALHCFRAGAPTALGKSPSAPSSCVLFLQATRARGICAQQHVPNHCLNDVALF